MSDIGIIGGADGPTAVLVASQFSGAFLLAALAVVMHIVFAFLFRNAAREKGHPMWRYFFLCLLFGLPGWILVAALPDRSIIAEIRRENKD